MFCKPSHLAALFLSACLSTLTPAVASTLDAAQRTHAFTIASKALDEERTVYVRAPSEGGFGGTYPVVYVLDAEWNFEYVAAYIENLVENGAYPPMVVTGIVNVNRNRDYVPRADRHFPHTGEADRFLDFVATEWIPRVEERFAGSGRRVLVGHSFGGVFTLHTLFTRPGLFDAYLAMGSSAWIADRVLFDGAEALFESGANPNPFVWMAVGENDGGPTIPSGKDLAALFELKAPASLEWTFSITPRTDHFTNFISGTHAAFMALFPSFGFDRELTTRARLQGAAGVDAWFAEKESSLGWRFQPAWFDLGVTALTLAREPATAEAARSVTAQLRRYFPDNAFIAFYSATVYEQSGMLAEALAEAERAITLAEERRLDPNELQIETLESSRQRIREAIAANASS